MFPHWNYPLLEINLHTTVCRKFVRQKDSLLSVHYIKYRIKINIDNVCTRTTWFVYVNYYLYININTIIAKQVHVSSKEDEVKY